MDVALLVYRGTVKKDLPAACPGDALGHEASPDIRHPEAAVRWEVHQRKGFPEPGRILTVERAPGAAFKGDLPVVETDVGAGKHHPEDRIHIRVAIGQALLNGEVAFLVPLVSGTGEAARSTGNPRGQTCVWVKYLYTFTHPPPAARSASCSASRGSQKPSSGYYRHRFQ